ncbi:MAG: hypothetical protein AB8H47_30920 [Bacteroidia bacterium]
MKKVVFTCMLVWGLVGCAERGEQTPASVYVSIEDFTHQYEPGSSKILPLGIRTMGDKAWQGEIHLDLLQKDSSLHHWQQSISVAADTMMITQIEIQLPRSVGTYHLQARIQNFRDEAVLSRRLIEVKTPVSVQIN